MRGPLKQPEHDPRRPKPPQPPELTDWELNQLRCEASVGGAEAMRELCRWHKRPLPPWAALPSTAAVQLELPL